MFEIIVMSPNNTMNLPLKPSDSFCHSTSAADAAKSLLCLVVADPGMFKVDTAIKKVYPTMRQRHLPILPPLSLEHDCMADHDMIEDYHEEEEELIGLPVALPSPITKSQWPRDVTFTNESDIGSNHDDDNLSLSLYIGAENEEYNLVVEDIPYRDLSNVPFAEVAVIAHDPEKRDAFPVLLHRILSNERYGQSIVWLPHGRAFEIVDEDKFFNRVCLSYFCTNQYEVFMWWIKTYGFRQVVYDDGQTKTTVFFHERFLRYRQWLAFTMNPSGLNEEVRRPPSSAECTAEEVFQKLKQFPFLQDAMVPHSLLLAHQLSFSETVPATCQQRQQLAHGYFPNPCISYGYGWQHGRHNPWSGHGEASNGGGTSIVTDGSWYRM